MSDLVITEEPLGSVLAADLQAGLERLGHTNFRSGQREVIQTLLRDRRAFKFLRGTILDERLMASLVRRCDVVFHLAAAVGVKYILEHPLGSLLTNIEGTQIVLKYANRYRKKLILASTSEIYGKHACAPFHEDDDRILGSTRISRWSYSEAKAIDEFLTLAYVKERRLSAIVARLFNTVGPRQTGYYGMVLPRFLEAAIENKPIAVFGDGSQVRCFAHVKDVARGLADLADSAKAYGEIFNIGTDQPITIKDLALRVKERTNSSSEIVFVSFEEAFGKKAGDFEEIECRIPDISKLKSFINFTARYSIDDIIRDTAAFLHG